MYVVVTPMYSTRERLTTMLRDQPDRLRRRAVSLGLRHEDAEDAAQTVALKALQGVERVRHGDEPGLCGWVDAIAKRVVIDHFRAADPVPGTLDDHILPQVSCPDAAVQRRRDLIDALNALPEEHRRVLALRFGRDLSSIEIARELGVSDAAARQRISRARNALTRLVGVATEPNSAATP